MSKVPVFLQGISAVVPDHEMSQAETLEFMIRHLADSPKKAAVLKRLYRATAIQRRFSVISDFGREQADYRFFASTDNLLPEPDTAKRNRLFVQEADALALKSVRRLFADLPRLAPASITHLITVSCTGFSAPGFDFHLLKELPLSPHVHRFHLGFMGCFAAFPAMKLAKHICESEPEARVLIVNLELCTLHFQVGFEADKIVANSLFSDGVSAALVSAVPDDALGGPFAGRSLVFHDFSSTIVPSSEDDMAWMIGEHGFDMKLSTYVPQLISKNLAPVLKDLFKNRSWTLDDVDLWAIHPGGREILDKLGAAFRLTKEDLAFSYQVLRDFGNMSSTTVMFVLREIQLSERKGKIFSAAFGPGLTVESAILEKN